MTTLAAAQQALPPDAVPRGSLSLLAGALDGPEAVDGPLAQARLADTGTNYTGNTPGVASNGASLYLADLGNHAIREVTPAGVRTIAGKLGERGWRDGRGEEARFDSPAGIAVGRDGDLFVADSGNHTIRKISVAGVVSTVAGKAGQHGVEDGDGAAARFNQPQGVAVDVAGNVYVADRGNHAVRRISPGGAVTTFAGDAGHPGTGDGRGRAASFERPQGIVVDAKGNVYVTDAENTSLRRITPDGSVVSPALLAMADAIGEPKATLVSLRGANGIAIDRGTDLVIVEEVAHRVRRVSQAGMVTNVAGNFDALTGSGWRDGPGKQARFQSPSGVAVSASGEMWVVDAGNATIRSIDREGRVSTIIGSARRHGTSESRDGPAADARFAFLKATGQSLAGLATSAAGDVFVAETQKHVLRKISSAGVVTTIAGADGQPGFSDGPGARARFAQPSAVAVDAGGALYVADSGNHTIRRVDPDGTVTTVAGQSGSEGFADGRGAAARFRFPLAIAIDAAGRLLVSDAGNHVVRSIDRGGQVTTIAGLPGRPGNADGDRGAALLERPGSIAVTAAGDIYLIDGAGRTRVRRIAADGQVTTPSAGFWRTPPLPRRGPIEFTARAFSGIAVGADDEVYLGNVTESVVWKIDRNGGVVVAAGDAQHQGLSLGRLPGRLSDLGALAGAGAGGLVLASGNAVLSLRPGND